MTGTIGLLAAVLTRSRLATRSLSIPTRSRFHSKPGRRPAREASARLSASQVISGDPSSTRRDNNALPEVKRREFLIRNPSFIEGAVKSQEWLVDRFVGELEGAEVHAEADT